MGGHGLKRGQMKRLLSTWLVWESRLHVETRTNVSSLIWHAASCPLSLYPKHFVLQLRIPHWNMVKRNSSELNSLRNKMSRLPRPVTLFKKTGVYWRTLFIQNKSGRLLLLLEGRRSEHNNTILDLRSHGIHLITQVYPSISLKREMCEQKALRSPQAFYYHLGSSISVQIRGTLRRN